MKKLFLTTLLATALFSANFANAAKECANPKTANVKVNGLVCDFCARTLEKTFGAKTEVSGIKVDLDKGMVDVNFKDGQKISDTEITKLITDAGYNVVNIDKVCGE
jgi:copper chaperone CopZ